MKKTVLVTGASSGFGEACARKFAGHHHRVILAARDIGKLLQLQMEIGAAGNVVALPLDVRFEDSLEHLFTALPAEFSAIDVLINNAGLALGTEPAHAAELDDWETMIATNITGLVRMTRRILPGMVARNRGHIVNMGSIAGSWPYPGGNTYGASKAFVQQFSRNLRADLLGKNIRVSNIDPGLAQTNFARVRMKGDNEKAANLYKNTQPLVADDIAEIIYWTTSVPEHVNINSIEVMPTCQAWAALAVDRTMLEVDGLGE